MNKDEISELRSHLLTSNPEIPQEDLTDDKIAAAIEQVSARKKQGGNSAEIPSTVASQPSSTEILDTNVTNGNLGEETKPEKVNEAEVMNVILQELQGGTKNITTNNPNLASQVDTFMGL